jgi:hypothetical protein
MLTGMQLVQRWGEIERGLPDRWAELDLTLTLAENAHKGPAAALLAPLGPALAAEGTLRMRVTPGEVPLVRRLMARLEQDNIDGSLAAGDVALAVQPAEPAWTPLVAAWDGLLATLPPDWSDLYLELELGSSDQLEGAALRLAPANPARNGPGSLRFRTARVFGYGVSAEMLRRCLARLDEEGVHGSLRPLRVLLNSLPVATQGPVWRLAGKSV